MRLPTQGALLSQAEVNEALNLSSFKGAVPKAGSKWHGGPHGGGEFVIWAMKYGYADGFPMYAHVQLGSWHWHIYFLNDGWEAPVILKAKETPEKYGIDPIAPASAPARKPVVDEPAWGVSAPAFKPTMPTAHATRLPVATDWKTDVAEFKPGT